MASRARTLTPDDSLLFICSFDCVNSIFFLLHVRHFVNSGFQSAPGNTPAVEGRNPFSETFENHLLFENREVRFGNGSVRAKERLSYLLAVKCQKGSNLTPESKSVVGGEEPPRARKTPVAKNRKALEQRQQAGGGGIRGEARGAACPES